MTVEPLNNSFRYEYIWEGHTKYYYAKGRVDADRQFEAHQGFFPSPEFVRVIRHNS